jgi:hypothetical protein
MMHVKPLSEFLGLRVTFSSICGNRMLKPAQNRPEFGALTAGRTHGFSVQCASDERRDDRFEKPIDIFSSFGILHINVYIKGWGCMMVGIHTSNDPPGRIRTPSETLNLKKECGKC